MFQLRVRPENGTGVGPFGARERPRPEPPPLSSETYASAAGEQEKV